MDLSIQLLNARIAKHQLDELDNDFKQLSPAQQTLQLNHLCETALRMDIKYDFMQNMATRILTTNAPPAPFVNQLTTTDAFTTLNDIKPAMVQEATEKAREVANKFAKDSNSTLGKIKTARQGQFSITNRDSNTPHIKKVRVVTSVEYYLSD